ncbi:putative Major facilitator superfamily (MFS) profile domain-containing protein [Seiridium unicorne]|uniref:Major facilitator superfamily (MFS) profile domain-containing protein n=1 Tax=Seiridium unicorne TaxID=138068 RepID=A0ABR2V242_9PEZI
MADLKGSDNQNIQEIGTAQTVDNAAFDTVQDAARATQVEHQMGFFESLKLYRKGVAWSMLLSTAIIMEGFDLILLGGLIAFPAFEERFGDLQADGTYELSATWQTSLSMGSLIGQIVGLFFNGYIADRFGYRYTMMGGLIMISGFIFIPFFSHSIVMFLCGQILLGIPFGCFQTLACTYASEVVPTTLRAYLTTYVNLCWVIGQIIASGLLRALVDRTDSWGYRIPVAVQWFWPIPLLIGCLFIPESPWWLVRQGRIEDAKRSLARLTSKSDSSFSIDETVAMIIYTDEHNKTISAGTSYLDCFKGFDLRRTEIVCMCWVTQVLSGSPLMGYSSYFYQQAGLDVSNAFTMTIAQFCLGGVGTVCSWFLMGRAGRRSIYLYGQGSMMVALFAIGFASLAGRSNVASQWAIGSLLLVYTFIYDCSVGPVCYTLVAELPSSRLRTKSVVLARNMYNLISIVATIITPSMLNPTAWNWGARLPEPKGKTYAELDVLFETKTPARKFQEATVDELNPEVLERKAVMEHVEKVDRVETQQITSSIQRVRRACDGCRLRRVKCNGDPERCQQCAHLNLRCVYTTARPKSSRTGVARGSVISRIKEKSASSTTAIASRSICSSHDSTASVGSSTSHRLSSPRELLQVAYSKEFFTALIDGYKLHVYPVNPIIAPSEILESIDRMDMPDHLVDNALVHAYAAVTLNLTTPNWQANQDESARIHQLLGLALAARNTVMTQCMTSARSSLHPHLTPHLIMTAIFAEICLMAVGKFSEAFMVLREAIAMVQLLRVDLLVDEQPELHRAQSGSRFGNDAHISPSERTRRIRMYWEAFIHERFLAIVAYYPPALSPLPPEVSLPREDTSIPTNVHVGWQHLIKLFSVLDDNFVHHWMNANNAAPKTVTYEWIESKMHYLNNLYDIDHIIITRQWLLMLLWQLAISNVLLTSEDTASEASAMSLQFPVRLSQQLRQVVVSLGRPSIERHGSGMLKKLFEITNALADVIVHVPTDSGGEAAQRKNDFNFLFHFLHTSASLSEIQVNLLLEKRMALESGIE